MHLYVCSGVRDHWLCYLRRQADGTRLDAVVVVRRHVVRGAVDTHCWSPVGRSAEQCRRSSLARLCRTTLNAAVNIAWNILPIALTPA